MSEESKVTTVTISTDQIDMFTIDIKNSDSSNGYWCSTNWTMSDVGDDITTVTIPTDQIDMFTTDIENGDWYYGHQYTTKVDIDDMCIPIDYNYTAGYSGLDYVHAGNKTKAFRKDVESFLIDIKRVSPAGSASFELAKDFMDNHYGEESK